ncbi:hypothetical protein VCHENC02_5744A, partial [Vibrio harveyi]
MDAVYKSPCERDVVDIFFTPLVHNVL